MCKILRRPVPVVANSSLTTAIDLSSIETHLLDPLSGSGYGLLHLETLITIRTGLEADPTSAVEK
ncbi:hypothetical protein TorRG33x02_133550 [Trema orientale]|uniref:Uncharacterized protein n=1 Tax=Trema orientale TaxID=63057 RepID=A0A2P5EZI8_TREOI|nr:hypothetical protein TorRG33x02_133550 [Trema orientale]